MFFLPSTWIARSLTNKPQFIYTISIERAVTNLTNSVLLIYLNIVNVKDRSEFVSLCQSRVSSFQFAFLNFSIYFSSLHSAFFFNFSSKLLALRDRSFFFVFFVTSHTLRQSVFRICVITLIHGWISQHYLRPRALAESRLAGSNSLISYFLCFVFIVKNSVNGTVLGRSKIHVTFSFIINVIVIINIIIIIIILCLFSMFSLN